MKKQHSSMLISIGPILLILLLIASCTRSEIPGPAIIAGQLPDLASTAIRTDIGDEIYEIETDNEGRFRMEVEIDQEHYLWFLGLGKSLYLVPGDSMFISTDESGIHPQVFSGGESALINTWYSVKDAKLATMLDTVDITNYYSQDASSFKKLNSWIISELHELLDQYCLENPGINDTFLALEKENIRHYWYYELNVYHLENLAYTGKQADLPEDFYDYLEIVLVNDKSLFQYPGYRYFLYSWLELQVHLKGTEPEGIPRTHRIFDLAEDAFTEPEILADVVWENLRLQNSRMNVDEELIDRARALGVPKERCEAAREYMIRLQSLSPGNPAPDFEIIATSGNTVSLEDFRGSYLLVDIWSTTCSPCIREIPRLEEIRHELEGKKIKLIAVCLSDESPWKEKLTQLGLPAEGQYRADNGWSSRFSNDYLKGSGVPVYVLIDPDGNFVNARAPYPSQGLREVLESLPI